MSYEFFLIKKVLLIVRITNSLQRCVWLGTNEQNVTIQTFKINVLFMQREAILTEDIKMNDGESFVPGRKAFS